MRIAGPPDGPKEIDITLRRSAQARRISLRVSGLDGQVTLTLPSRVRESEGLAFAKARVGWIAEAMARAPKGQVAKIGALIPIEGLPRRVIAGPAKGAVHLAEEGLVVPGDPTRAATRIVVWLKHLARRRINDSVTHYAGRLGRPHGTITLRDTRSRWGSCAASGDLMFSWRLILAPAAVLDYVAAHEVAHLAEMNHSSRFWAEVERLLPGYEAPRGWLRQHGASLHAWRFED